MSSVTSFGRSRTLGILLAILPATMLLTSCGPSDDGPKTARREVGPQWQDVFDGTPEIYAVVRPQAIKRDAVYGVFFKNVLRVAQAKSAMRGATTLEALEGCEEIIVGIRKDQNGEDAALVIRGVPASLDPAKMTDAAGHPVLRLVDSRARVPEYEWIDRQSAGAGSVFVLPDRTWVGTIGDARGRARQAFASPFGRPTPKSDPEALATVRLDAATFLLGPRFANSQVVGPLTRKLRAVTLALQPGKAGVIVQLQYDGEDASALAEMHTKRILDEIARQPPKPGKASLDWLKTATVTHENNTVIVKLAIPPRLLEDLPNATGSDLSL
ncbi:MAG: hypothetical protein JWO86_7988 [Myxococcaceae bacterium]|nr:hypothetical protein [Myxococcaceae bacterium]